jgi:hypothetical protein
MVNNGKGYWDELHGQWQAVIIRDIPKPSE